jgi:peptide deformylase
MKIKAKHLATAILMTIVTSGCKQEKQPTWTENEKALITQEMDTRMRLVTIETEEDSLFLRNSCLPLSKEDLTTPEFEQLKKRMLLTVTNPENEGVGIAAPQVGIGRQLIAVQRIDKKGMPFEFYVNPQLTYLSEEKRTGREGCLSVPDRNGNVTRSEWVVVTHNDMGTYELRHDTIRGFTAIIFQHETDHLNGILYIDKVE